MRTIVINYVTDSMTYNTDVTFDRAYLSPDARQFVTVTHNTLSAYKVMDTGGYFNFL